MIPANVKVIAAGSERQMASWEEDSSHSLFTKYFLKAMSGEGDSNKDGKVSDAELKGRNQTLYFIFLFCRNKVNETLKIIINPPNIVYRDGILLYQIKSSSIDIGGIK